MKLTHFKVKYLLTDLFGVRNCLEKSHLQMHIYIHYVHQVTAIAGSFKFRVKGTEWIVNLLYNSGSKSLTELKIITCLTYPALMPVFIQRGLSKKLCQWLHIPVMSIKKLITGI